MTQLKDDLMDTYQVTQYLGISRSSLLQLEKDGEIVSDRGFTYKKLFLKRDVLALEDRWLAKLEEKKRLLNFAAQRR